MASIVKRKNRYSVVYTYKDDDGNQHQKWETFDTNADAKKRKTQIEFERDFNAFKETFKKYAEAENLNDTAIAKSLDVVSKRLFKLENIGNIWGAK